MPCKIGEGRLVADESENWTLPYVFVRTSNSGAVSGFAARNAVIPDRKSAIILLANTDRGNGFAKLHNKLLSLLLEEPSQAPKIRGATAVEAAEAMFRQLQAGKVERKQLGAEFSAYLDTKKLQSAAKQLKRYGKPKSVKLEEIREREGMEVSTVRLTFEIGTLSALMYREPDGTIEQFFVEAEPSGG